MTQIEEIADLLEYSGLSLELDFVDAVVAGSVYGKLLDLDRRSEKYYGVESHSFEIENYLESDNTYRIKVNLTNIHPVKMERILKVLFENDPEEKKE